MKTKQILLLLNSGDLQLYNFNIDNSDSPELCFTTNHKDLVDSSSIKNSAAITSIHVC